MNIPVQVGEIVAGKYRVDAVLGRGAMGAVVSAIHLDLGERRAIKLMLPTALNQGEAVARFMREARAASRLKSEHVAHVHDVGTLEDGSPFMVMEHLDGSDLRSMMRQRGRVSVAEAAGYALQVCEALAEAHGLGIVHRDLKPANLFLTLRHDQSPCVKVLDFGISKMDGGDVEMTQTDVVLGSPAFMSPEQMRSSRDVDARTDLWSLGVILYQLVTGRLPFPGKSIAEIVASVLEADPPAPSVVVVAVPAGFDAVVARCLAPDRDRRYGNVAELAADLAPFAGAFGRASADRVLRVFAAVSASSGRPALRLSLPTDGGASSPATASSAPWVSTVGVALRRSRLSVAIALVGLGAGALTGVGVLRHPLFGGATDGATASHVAAPSAADASGLPRWPGNAGESAARPVGEPSSRADIERVERVEPATTAVGASSSPALPSPVTPLVSPGTPASSATSGKGRVTPRPSRAAASASASAEPTVTPARTPRVFGVD